MSTRKMTVEVVGDVRDGQRKLEGFAVTVDETGGRFDGMADKVATGWAVIQGGQAAFDIVGNINAMGTSIDTVGVKADTVFGPALGRMQTWADDMNEALGVTDTQLLGMGSNMADLLVPMGASRDQAADITQEMLNLSGALSAWSQGERSAAEVSEILSAAMLGEREALKSLGISINQAEVDQKALTIAQADGRTELTQMDRALATQQLILEKSTDAQTAWADGSMDAVKNQNELKASVAELKEGLVEALFPAIEKTTRFLVDDALPAFRRLGEFVSENREYFIAAAIGITAALIPAFIGWATAAGSAAAATLVAAAPVIAIGAAVAALAAGLVWAYQNVDWFRDSVDAVATFLRDVALPAAVGFGEGVVGAVQFIWDKAEPLIGLFVDQIGRLITIGREVISFWKDVFSGDWSGAWDSIKAIASTAIDLMFEPLKLLGEGLWELIKRGWQDAIQLMQLAGIWLRDGVKDLIGSALGGVGDLGLILWDWIKAGWDWAIGKFDQLSPLNLASKIPGVGLLGDVGNAVAGALKPLASHSGSTFMSGSGGEGWAWLQDGQRVLTPAGAAAHGAGGGSDIIELHIGDEVITRAVERTATRRVVRVV